MVTDRLHATILALMLHLPHVVLDNYYGKLQATRRNVAFNMSDGCLDEAALRYVNIVATSKANHTGSREASSTAIRQRGLLAALRLLQSADAPTP